LTFDASVSSGDLAGDVYPLKLALIKDIDQHPEELLKAWPIVVEALMGG
jgi:hypothetical protein